MYKRHFQLPDWGEEIIFFAEEKHEIFVRRMDEKGKNM